MKAQWLEFSGPKPTPSGKTFVWMVYPKGGIVPLGSIAWYGPWRKYAFQPSANTVFEPTCLRDLAAFIDEKMAERKAAKGKPAARQENLSIRTCP